MPITTALQYVSNELPTDVGTFVVLGQKAVLAEESVRSRVPVDDAAWEAILERLGEGGDWGASTTTWVGRTKIVVAVLPKNASRHSPPSRSWAVASLVKTARSSKDAAILLAVPSPDEAFPLALAVARSFPEYDRKTSRERAQTVSVAALCGGSLVEDPRIQPGMDGARLCARLVDMPASELSTTAFVSEAHAAAGRTGATIRVIDDCTSAGLGGIWGVGKAATHPPALVVLERVGEGTKMAWVGKGIVYDTGGLSLKGKDHMPGMKGDMGGAAAVLGGFEAACHAGLGGHLIAVLCLAENSVGPDATRPDDILTMHSGKTVEVNNTDAEGRLALADGVSFIGQDSDPDIIVDLATLTGAALVTTGKVHAGVYSNDADLEALSVQAGSAAGNPVYPFIYAPELLRKEFKSHVADMKNSVKDRGNAQSSCAALFVETHLAKRADGSMPRWLHVDLAGPAWDSQNRGTGFGVGLLMELAQRA
ncbi:MAG: leucyl aminopeptidase family protein [Proteobacteria bacterium]|nr:leucyl aminopeptidase family protein [Pseudomonadota bacterium]MCP4920094.1 leucyl aminopeptidase family protein [Pseudomonadota bacterium]